MAYDLLLRKDTGANWARGTAPKPLPLAFSPGERKGLLLLEPSTRQFAVGLIAWARARGIPARLFPETYRSQADQEKEIREGRSSITPGKIGWHQVGRAFHLVILLPDGRTRDKEAYRVVGVEARRRGGEWLGDRPLRTRKGLVEDLAHYEYHPGLDIGPYRRSKLAIKELKDAARRAARYA